MIRPALLAAVFALVVLPPGSAEAAYGSGRWGSVELGAQTYRPDVDSDLTDPRHEQVFGGGRGWMFQLGLSRALYTGFGSLEGGLRTGYFQDSGRALLEDGSRSEVETKFRIVPTSLSLTYRFDWPVERHGIPLAPYARATLERYNWWVSDADGTVERGATNGWSVTAGLAFLLDILDPGSARDLDRDAGVNHTYLFGEITRSSVDDFGSSSSWDLSDEDLSLGFGLLFVF